MRRVLAALIAVLSALGAGTMTAAPAVATPSAGELAAYLDLSMPNRDADAGPGGIHPDLPTDRDELHALLTRARADGIDPTRYQALLFQFWFADTTDAAGIDLATWDPRAGVTANRDNLMRSYRFYEDLQLNHRELQWAGMAGLVGADFGGGLIDFRLATDVYDFAGLAPIAHAIVGETNRLLGPFGVEELPSGLRALAQVGASITAADLRHIQADILVMQKNIFGDLMTMHRAYVVGGLPALEEMSRAGLYGEEILDAWRQIASGDPVAVAAGNARLLQREQGEVVAEQWDRTRAYRGVSGQGEVGEAMTYATTLAGSPSVAGVVPPRSFRPLTVTGQALDGRTATVTLPLPAWNWAAYPQRWAYITDQLLPRYRDLVEHRWPQLQAALQVPYERQIESHRPIWNVAATLQSALETVQVTYE